MSLAPSAAPSAAPSTAGAQAWRFLLLAFTVGWAPWMIAASGAAAQQRTLANVLLLAGPLLVAASALLLLALGRDRAARRDYARALLDARRVAPWAWPAALLLMPALAMTAAALEALRSGLPIEPGAFFALARQPGAGAAGLAKALGSMLLIGPILEEMSFRGYALPRLQLRYGALAGALLLSCAHALWHLPLFFIAGTGQQVLGVFTLQFWGFLAEIVAFGMIAAALFGATGGSVLAVVLLHVGFNLAGGMVSLSAAAQGWRLALELLLALAIWLVLAPRSGRKAVGPGHGTGNSS